MDDGADEKPGDIAAESAALDEEQLASLFKKTSTYSVSSVLKGNAVMFEKPIVEDGFVTGFQSGAFEGATEADWYEEVCDAADYELIDANYDSGIEADAFGNFDDSDDDDDRGAIDDRYHSGDELGDGRKARRRRGKKGVRTRGAKGGKSKAASSRAVIGAQFKSYVDGRGKSRGGPIARVKRICSEVLYTRIPPFPLPPTWCHMIATRLEQLKLRELSEKASKYIEMDITKIQPDTFGDIEYQAILIDFPFDLMLEERWGDQPIDVFEALPIGDIKNNHMLFVWTPSELILEVTEACEKWGYRFTEHATWVRKLVNNRFDMQEDSEVFAVCKCNLLLFRRTKPNGTYFKMELRHQRTSDVWFDYTRPHPETGRDLKAYEYTYDLIETMLPNTLRTVESEQRPTMLYIGAPKNEKRFGWTTVWDNEEHGRKILL
jgi:hypothetical protein